MPRPIALTWNLNSGHLSVPGGFYLKRGETVEFILTVKEDGSKVLLDTGWELNLTVKPRGVFDTLVLVQVLGAAGVWTEDATAKTYSAEVEISSLAINTLLNKDGSGTNDVAQAPCILDLASTVADANPVKCQTVHFNLENDVARDDDGTPAAVAQPILTWLRNPGLITSETGAATSLDAVLTASSAFTVGNIIGAVITDELQWWILKAGTAANVTGAIRRPTDYNASTNAVYWQRIS